MTQAPTPGPLSASRVGTNSGHGHAWKRPDGVKSRCGGPGLCAPCSKDAALVADVVFAGKQTLAPPAPVEASGSELEKIARLVDPEAWVAIDMHGVHHSLSIQQRCEDSLKRAEKIAALRPQPSGETREQVALALERIGAAHVSATGENIGHATVLAIEAELLALIIPDPVASGGQHSSGEVETLRVLLDNLVIAQTLSKDLRQNATDEARSYLYELRHAAPVAETAGEAVAWRWRIGDDTPWVISDRKPPDRASLQVQPLFASQDDGASQ